MALLGCGCDCGGPEGPPPPSASLVADVQALQGVVGTDPAILPLEEVDRAVAADRPVRGARLLELGAIAAARQQVEHFEALELSSDEGRALRDLAVTRYGARVTALEEYRVVLERGLVEDLALVEALRAQRLAAEGIGELQLQFEEIRPLQEPRPSRRDRPSGGMGGRPGPR